ncbi:MAG: NBR1-Ig-like domain-containing protein [Anaerolineae bacterium]
MPHHTEMAPGQPYEKVWRILNSGCQLWTPDTQIVYNQGNLLTGPQAATLNTSVAPGETIDIALPFTAPQDPGSYEAYYLLQTAQGETFGLAYYTGIVVPEEVEPADPIDDLAPPEGAEGPTIDICSWGASIVENGGTVEVEPGQPFSMTFTVYNGGSCDWPSGTQLFTISGDPILSDGTYTFSEGQLAAAGESVTFTLNGTAPNQEGIYAAVVGFRPSPNGIVFGPNLGLTVEVTFPQLDFVAPGG